VLTNDILNALANLTKSTTSSITVPISAELSYASRCTVTDYFIFSHLTLIRFAFNVSLSHKCVVSIKLSIKRGELILRITYPSSVYSIAYAASHLAGVLRAELPVPRFHSWAINFGSDGQSVVDIIDVESRPRSVSQHPGSRGGDRAEMCQQSLLARIN